MDWNSATTKKFMKEAKAVGLTLIGEGKKAQYRTYRFNKCKHKQEIAISSVRSNKIRCNQCLQIKLENEAKAVGLTLVSKGRNKNYRTYRFNKCKHKQEIAIGRVRDSSFICNTCEETSRNLPSKVYLLKIQSGSFMWLKLGYAKSIRFRIKQYRLLEGAKIKRLKVIDFDTGREAHKSLSFLESSLPNPPAAPVINIFLFLISMFIHT